MSRSNIKVADYIRNNIPTNIDQNDIDLALDIIESPWDFRDMKKLNIILTFGQIAHNSLIIAFNKKLSEYKFKHLKQHKINDKIILINCYHCSKYNINTKRLKISDLDNIFKLIKELLHF